MSVKVDNQWQNYGFILRGDPVEVQQLVDSIDGYPNIRLIYVKNSENELTVTNKQVGNIR